MAEFVRENRDSAKSLPWLAKGVLTQEKTHGFFGVQPIATEAAESDVSSVHNFNVQPKKRPCDMMA